MLNKVFARCLCRSFRCCAWIVQFILVKNSFTQAGILYIEAQWTCFLIPFFQLCILLLLLLLYCAFAVLLCFNYVLLPLLLCYCTIESSLSIIWLWEVAMLIKFYLIDWFQRVDVTFFCFVFFRWLRRAWTWRWPSCKIWLQDNSNRLKLSSSYSLQRCAATFPSSDVQCVTY